MDSFEKKLQRGKFTFLYFCICVYVFKYYEFTVRYFKADFRHLKYIL